MKLFGKEIIVKDAEKVEKTKKAKTFVYIDKDGNEVEVEGTVKHKFFNKKNAMIAGGLAAAGIGTFFMKKNLEGDDFGDGEFTEVGEDIGDVGAGDASDFAESL